MPTAYRYALYLAPAGSLREVGQRWLGRCADTGLPLARSAGADPREASWTQAPRRYGLHATIKAPFRLRAGATPASLDQAVRRFARTGNAFGLPLQRVRLRGFLAWCIADDRARQRMNALAGAAVTALDEYRAPPLPDELQRRQIHLLEPAQRMMLQRWGYPYAFDTYTFHITLTGQLAEADLTAAGRRLDALDGPALQAPMPVRAVSLYVEPEPGADFVVARHYGFDGSCTDGCGARYLDGECA